MMENSRPDAERYKPSINIERAPGIATPLMYIGTAYVFLIAAAVVFISSAKWIAHGAYGNPLVIMMVHFFTLGFLSMTAMGILNQWVPVVFDVPPLGVRRGYTNFILYLLGVVGFAWGFAQERWVLLAASGTLLALAILIWSLGIAGQLSRSSKPRDAVYRGIQGALAGFNVVWIMGVFMALSFLGWWPEYHVLRVHIATALVAWMGFLVLTVQQKLNPMFSMSKAEGINFGIPLYLAAAGVLLGWVSLITSGLLVRIGGVFWVAAVVVTVVQSIHVVRQGRAKTFDPVFIGVAAAWVLLLAAAMLAVWMSPLAIIVAFWGMLTLILSYQSRILPFVVAVFVAKRLPGPVYKAFFMAQAMHSKSQPIVVGGLGIIGAVLSVLGRVTGHAGPEVAGGVAALLLVGSEIANVAIAMARGRRQGPARP